MAKKEGQTWEKRQIWQIYLCYFFPAGANFWHMHSARAIWCRYQCNQHWPLVLLAPFYQYFFISTSAGRTGNEANQHCTSAVCYWRSNKHMVTFSCPARARSARARRASALRLLGLLLSVSAPTVRWASGRRRNALQHAALLSQSPPRVAISSVVVSWGSGSFYAILSALNFGICDWKVPIWVFFSRSPIFPNISPWLISTWLIHISKVFGKESKVFLFSSSWICKPKATLWSHIHHCVLQWDQQWSWQGWESFSEGAKILTKKCHWKLQFVNACVITFTVCRVLW